MHKYYLLWMDRIYRLLPTPQKPHFQPGPGYFPLLEPRRRVLSLPIRFPVPNSLSYWLIVLKPLWVENPALAIASPVVR